MASSSHSSKGSESDSETGGRFRFVSMQQAPDEPKDQMARRRARSHAVKQALQDKRRLQQNSSDHFRVVGLQDGTLRVIGKRAQARATPMPFFCRLSAGVLDPFHSLAVDSSRLQAFLSDYRTRQAPEPVFSVTKELGFQSFRSVFRTGLVDAALTCAVMLSLAFEAARGDINGECLRYRGRAIGHVRERMDSPGEATSESTIGAILLLAGVEARLGMTSQVQLHMGAVRLLLDLCRTKGIYLTGGIKRAIFWQDLNSSILAESNRIVDHTTFAELQWSRDPFSPTFFQLPPRFQSRAHLLTKEFTDVLENLHALQCIRNLSTPTNCDSMMMAHINNHTASIQSRLMSLQDLSPAMSCCRLAAYLCSVMLCCKVWCALVIPSHMSLQLLQALQQAGDDPVWDDHPDLLTWVLFIGGAFAPYGMVRTNYSVLLRSKHAPSVGGRYGSWPELLNILKGFIWSDRAFMPQVKVFWEEVFT